MKIGIFGMGAVGCSLYNELGEYKDLYVLADRDRCDKYENAGFIINGKKIIPRCLSAGIMDLVIVTVKNFNLEASLAKLKSFIDKNTVILPLLNGITAHDVLKAYFKDNNVLYGVINVESNKEGNVCETSKIYNLQFGEEYNEPIKAYLKEYDDLFTKYNVNHGIYPDMKRRVWLKWMLNMGINQISALCNATYEDMGHPLLQSLLHNIFEEVYLVSREYKINITYDDVIMQDEYCKKFRSNRVTSLTIDVNADKENELDIFSPTLIKLAEAKKIDVPYCRTIYYLLKSYIDNKKTKRSK